MTPKGTPLPCSHCGDTIAYDDGEVSNEVLLAAAKNHQRYCTEKGTTMPPQSTTPGPTSGPTTDRRPPAQHLLDHPVKAIARQAAKLLEEDAKLTRMWRDDLTKAKVREELAAAEAKVAALKAQLRGGHPKKPPKAMQPADFPDAKTIRAWAQTAGVDCPTTGKLPRTVIDAYHTRGAGAA